VPFFFVNFDTEVQFLETLPSHPNIVRYLFHHFDHEKGRARLFMTKYSSSLRDVIVRRSLGIGDPLSGVDWCKCCPKCTHVHTLNAPPLHFSLLEAASILLDIAQGVQFLHFNQILHRDL
jgi:serine/threonine protein kinase